MLFDQKLDLANLAFTQSPSAEDIGLSFDKVLSSPWRQSSSYPRGLSRQGLLLECSNGPPLQLW